MNLANVPISKIIPDVNQPREYFDEATMGRLRNSIKQRGIKLPLKLELQDDSTYIIQDGERRYRAAKELGLKEVPATIEPKTTEAQRLIEQFHLQEMHESWTPMEKANAISRLAEILSSSIVETAELVGLPKATVHDYMAFSKILDKKNLIKNRIPLRDARYIEQIKGTARRIAKANEIEFGRTEEKVLENAIYIRVKNGEPIRQMTTRLKDSFTQSPKSIVEFMENDEITAEHLFNKTNAHSAYALRNIHSNARFLERNIHTFQKHKGLKVPKELLTELKSTVQVIKDFVTQYES